MECQNDSKKVCKSFLQSIKISKNQDSNIIITWWLKRRVHLTFFKAEKLCDALKLLCGASFLSLRPCQRWMLKIRQVSFSMLPKKDDKSIIQLQRRNNNHSRRVVNFSKNFSSKLIMRVFFRKTGISGLISRAVLVSIKGRGSSHFAT